MMYCEVNVGERIRYFRNLTRLEPGNAGFAGGNQPGFSWAFRAWTEKSDDKNTGKDRAGA